MQPRKRRRKINKVTLGIVLLVLITVTSRSAIQVSTSQEWSSNMPVVYVDPDPALAAKGTTFNVSVRIFNLTNSFYATNEEWKPGEPLGPSGGLLYNYSLGNLHGFNISFSWDPAVLDYVSRSVKTPVEEYPDGVLHQPIWESRDEINSTAGTYSVVQRSSYYPIAAFNCPNRSATIFTITFKVRANRAFKLRLESVELMIDYLLQTEHPKIIPHQTRPGWFVPVITIRIASIDVGALIGEQLYSPLILGEDATVRVLVTNDGMITNTYDITLYDGPTLLATLKSESLASHKEVIHSFSLKAEDLERGLNSITAKADILYGNTTIVDSLTKDFTVVDTPLLRITSSPDRIRVNDTVTLSAAESVHQDERRLIVSYTWSLYEPRATAPAYQYEDMSVTHTFTENGTWRIVLVVKDDLGVTYDSRRKATTPYRKEIFFDIPTGSEPASGYVFTDEQVATIIIGLIITTAIGFLGYITRRKRS